jgi:hypothetical protein
MRSILKAEKKKIKGYIKDAKKVGLCAVEMSLMNWLNKKENKIKNAFLSSLSSRVQAGKTDEVEMLMVQLKTIEQFKNSK